MEDDSLDRAAIDAEAAPPIAVPGGATTGAAKGNGGIAAPEEGFGSRSKISSARDAAPPLRCSVALAGGIGFTSGWAIASGSGRSWTTRFFGDVDATSCCCFEKSGRTRGSAPTTGFAVGTLSVIPILPDSVPPVACCCVVLPIGSFALATGVLSPAARSILWTENGRPSPASFSGNVPAKPVCRCTSRAPRVPCKRAVMAQVAVATGGDKD